jgi:hypothetical protein
MAQMVLIKVKQRTGIINGSDIYETVWVDEDDGTVHVMTADSEYENFKRSNWDKILTGDVAYGLYGGLKRTQRKDKHGLPVINADSRPQLIEPMTTNQAEELYQACKEKYGLR